MNELTRDGEQLEFRLFDSEPWDGRSPRALTKARKALFLRQKPPSHEVFFDPEQLEFWPETLATQKDAPPVRYGGAPLLVDVARGRRPRFLLEWEDEDG